MHRSRRPRPDGRFFRPGRSRYLGQLQLKARFGRAPASSLSCQAELLRTLASNWTNLLAKTYGMAKTNFVVFSEIDKESFSNLKTNFVQSLYLEPIKRSIYENR